MSNLTKEDLLIELCKEQYDLLKYVNGVLFKELKDQLKLPEDKRNDKLLELAWFLNDGISDNPQILELMVGLKNMGIIIQEED